jgi:GNAT superfamily N-acetyltransferase
MAEPVSPLRIKEATKEDVPLILSFVRELAQYEKALDKVTATEEGLRAALFGPRPYAEAVIVYGNDEAVAFAIYFFSFTSFSARPCLYLEDIFVRTSSRGSGVGRKLFAFLAKRAIERDCARMEWAVLNWNQPAINFYKRLGATPVNDWTVFRLSDENLAQLATETSQ